MIRVARRFLCFVTILSTWLSVTGAAFTCETTAEGASGAIDMAGMPGMPWSEGAVDPDTPADRHDCPLAMLGNGASCFAAALTESVDRTPQTIDDSAGRAVPADDQMRATLLAFDVFHPPKA
ncbi:MAG: hypothetical protein WEE89_07295 [Gemmatimonadota bacterium]